MTDTTPMSANRWPDLSSAEWSETAGTLHMLTQIVGKIRMAHTPWINHSWGVTLYPTARGLTTSTIPHPGGIFQIDFDFVEHRLLVTTVEGDARALELRSRTIADYYDELISMLSDLGRETRIRTTPNEVAEAIPFDRDQTHSSYDPELVSRFWRALLETERVFRRFRSRFIGKCSPVHFFWGAPDLAVTRFSGRPAPAHPGGFPNLPDWVTREAYSHEVSSAGFWPGDGESPAIFYSYAYPEPEGFADAMVAPEAAYYHPELREFVIPYEAVRTAASPDDVLLEFLQSTYEAAADLAEWDRSVLERQAAPGPHR